MEESTSLVRLITPPSCRRKVIAFVQTLWAIGQFVAEREPWVRRQCAQLEELSPELDCVKGLAWPKRATGAQGEA